MEASFQSRWYSTWSGIHPELLLLKVRKAARFCSYGLAHTAKSCSSSLCFVAWPRSFPAKAGPPGLAQGAGLLAHISHQFLEVHPRGPQSSRCCSTLSMPAAHQCLLLAYATSGVRASEDCGCAGGPAEHPTGGQLHLQGRDARGQQHVRHRRASVRAAAGVRPCRLTSCLADVRVGSSLRLCHCLSRTGPTFLVCGHASSCCNSHDIHCWCAGHLEGGAVQPHAHLPPGLQPHRGQARQLPQRLQQPWHLLRGAQPPLEAADMLQLAPPVFARQGLFPSHP